MMERYEDGVTFTPADTARLNEILGTFHDTFRKRRNPVFKSGKNNLYATFGDSGKDISWNKLIDKPNPQAVAKKAMRWAIVPQIKRAMASMIPGECAWCGTDAALVCDHKDIAFVTLATEWMTLRGTPETTEGPQGIGRVIADPEMLVDWCAFHEERATYQLLCGPCNSKKGAKGEGELEGEQ